MALTFQNNPRLVEHILDNVTLPNLSIIQTLMCTSKMFHPFITQWWSGILPDEKGTPWQRTKYFFLNPLRMNAFQWSCNMGDSVLARKIIDANFLDYAQSNASDEPIVFPTISTLFNIWIGAAAFRGNFDIIHILVDKRLLISYEDTSSFWSSGLHGVATANRSDVIEYFLNKGADVNYGLFGACMGNHYSLAIDFINKGATDFRKGILYATLKGNINLIDLMMERGDFSSANMINEFLADACSFNCLKSVKHFVSKGATNLDYALTQTNDPKIQAYLRSISHPPPLVEAQQ